jgi:hypothetical protein
VIVLFPETRLVKAECTVSISEPHSSHQRGCMNELWNCGTHYAASFGLLSLLRSLMQTFFSPSYSLTFSVELISKISLTPSLSLPCSQTHADREAEVTVQRFYCQRNATGLQFGWGINFLSCERQISDQGRLSSTEGTSHLLEYQISGQTKGKSVLKRTWFLTTSVF